ncbi:monoacylglycerol/Diacylglycerol O-acyltransferase-like [Pantherophis guttatus]|uniref:Monoacylglycerol/Diacylglycerol O-acyltransferase-like n=1 Tax=Pantherophis guttatus TaxID=94885 RepID=A0A6P9CZQ1_PANGU|nr:monoacylglycerol/Diacylglycerol O-acyltransferase-like [Pantherophis guttatus]
MNEKKATMLNTPEYESMTWFLHMLKDWIIFGYLEDFVNSVLQPLLLLLAFFLLIYCLPSGIVLVCYACTFCLYIWKKKYNIKGDIYNELWNKPRQRIANLVALCGKILHGYEIIGMENIPEGPGLIVYYHGAVVLDYVFFIATLYGKTGRIIHSVVHCFFYLVPGIKLCLDIVGCIEGKQTFCADILKRGYLLGIAPGGLREQNFSNENYNLEWSTHTGFAKVALKNKVPIIPMFTENIREAYRTVGNTRLSKWLYEHFRFIVLPMYGGFPVKLRTYIGEPIPYDPNLTASELAEKTKIAIENLRDRHQKLPGNIFRALLERFDKNKKDA